jgi:hypothetical protein
VDGSTTYNVVTYTGPGTFIVPASVTSIEYLVVGGGGGGGRGSSRTGGGGSGGEVVTGSLSVSTGQNITINIGAGGWGATIAAAAGNGQPSSIDAIVADGGGRGGQAAVIPGTGAYGGGNHHGQNGVTGTTSFSGGNGFDQGFGTGSFSGGGGGGANGNGQNGSSSKAGNGGAGISNVIQTGSAIYYGGGGAGGFQRGTGGANPGAGNQGSGGLGGGGNGGWTLESWTSGGSPSGSDGSVNTGGGGGGAAIDSRSSIIAGGAGGSGIVLLRYVVNSSLPVRWGTFTASVQSNDVLLKWATLQETNTSHFKIQHSTDGNNWNTIGTVAAAGNSQQNNNYSFVHTSPTNGINYYRLQQLDIDGHGLYSKTAMINISANSLRIYPNPVQHGIFSIYTDKATTVEVFNSAGIKVHSQLIQPGTQMIQITHPVKGVYLLRAGDKSMKLLLE